MLAEHLPPGSHELRGGGWGGQELQAPAQFRPPRAKASRAERAPGGSTARCIQPGQQWPQEPWRWGTPPCPSSLARWSSSDCSQQECPLFPGGSHWPPTTNSSLRGSVLSQLQKLRRFSQSQDVSLPRKPIITLVSASVTARWSLKCSVSLEQSPQRWGAAEAVVWAVLRGWHGAWGNLHRSRP